MPTKHVTANAENKRRSFTHGQVGKSASCPDVCGPYRGTRISSQNRYFIDQQIQQHFSDFKCNSHAGSSITNSFSVVDVLKVIPWNVKSSGFGIFKAFFCVYTRRSNNNHNSKLLSKLVENVTDKNYITHQPQHITWPSHAPSQFTHTCSVFQ